MSAITYAELEYGVSVSSNPKRQAKNLAELIEDIQVAASGTEAAVSYGPIRLATRDSKKDHLDKLIAAHAASLGSVLVTNNVKDFAKYPGVVLENWL
jgi:tRNA(fMet)-specific endonuclease VapC